MKKREFIQLLEKELDENDSIHHVIKDYDGDTLISAVAFLGFYYKKSTENHFDVVSNERIVVLNWSGDVDGYVRASEKPFYERRLEIYQQFPKDKKNWSIEQSYSNSIQIKFEYTGFVYHFSLALVKGVYHIMHFGKDMNHVLFTTWEDFFQQAKPLVLKSLQKYREELECFDVNNI